MTYAASLQITTATAWDTWYDYSDRACHDTAKVYRWYVATFFSPAANARYQWIGEMLGCFLALAIIYTQSWVDNQVTSALPTEDAPSPAPVAQEDPFDIPQLVSAIPAAIAPVATLVVQVEATDYSALTSAELRKVCSARGITWRNAKAKGRHLSKAEMIAALA